MKVFSAVAVSVLIVSGAALAQHSAMMRTPLQQHDLDIPGHEAVQVRLDLAPGGIVPRHKHPGEEIVYVLQGTLEYDIDGEPPVTLKPGGVLFIPTGIVHAAKNVGDGTASELSTYIVEKGKPLVIPVP
jgi:quercetin dioxygenase-like cupin family protein